MAVRKLSTRAGARRVSCSPAADHPSLLHQRGSGFRGSESNELWSLLPHCKGDWLFWMVCVPAAFAPLILVQTATRMVRLARRVHRPMMTRLEAHE
jgi:hypothetical protein